MICVSSAILVNANGELLICRRGNGGFCAHLWEFPGGKQEVGETLEECAVRECKEELGVEITLDRLYGKTSSTYKDKPISFYFYLGRIVAGVLVPAEHEELRWVETEALSDYEFCPADGEMVQKLMGAAGERLRPR